MMDGDGPWIALVVATLFIALPWLVLHYVTKWKKVPTLTAEDENLLDSLYTTARRFEDRLDSIERIIAADNPNWRQIGQDPVARIESDLEQRRLSREK